jgi:hypothetical protein
MKRVRALLVMLIVLWVFSRRCLRKKNQTPMPAAHYDLVQVTIAETDGEKVVNLPYTYYLRAGEGGPAASLTKLRLGSRIPVYVGKENGMQYLDVGTSIDSRAYSSENGRFDITLNLERSWVEGDVWSPRKGLGTNHGRIGSIPRKPIIRQFKTELTLTMRDGQSTQATLAADR